MTTTTSSSTTTTTTIYRTLYGARMALARRGDVLARVFPLPEGRGYFVGRRSAFNLYSTGTVE